MDGRNANTKEKGEDDPPALSEVLDILGMWESVESSYDQLPLAEQEWLKAEAELFEGDPEFSGFDGNNEAEHLAIAEFLINKLDRFIQYEGRDLNSHRRVLDGYRRMLPVFNSFERPDSDAPLSAEQLAQVLKAQVRSSDRL